ncbi:MAG: ABC transporter substrate-binding protein [Patulibacter sp.]
MLLPSPTSHASPRRSAFSPNRRASLLAAGAALALSLGACGGNDESTSATDAAATSSTAATSFTPSPGTDIPTVKVRFAMWPYGDTTLGVVGIKQGWFKEVGIDLVNGDETRPIDQVHQQLVNDQLDVGSALVSLQLQSYAKSPQLKMFQLQNSYIGNYVMASPKAGAKDYDAFASQGQDFSTAFKSAVGQMKGKRVALSDTGINREFFNTVLRLGGLKPADIKLQLVSDAKIVQLAKAGSIDYGLPGGAAQNVELLNLGFTRIAGVQQLLDGLPAGNPDAANGIAHAGLQASEAWIEGNEETVLRMMGVFYRIIDEIQNQPREALKQSLPILSKSAGVDLTLDDAETMFKLFYGTVNFEQAKEIVEDKDAKLYYETIYKPQIDAAKAGGVLPKDDEITPDDIIVFKKYYEILAGLKGQYDSLLASEKPTGELADKAKAFYEERDYLDAYRFLKAATEA